MNGSNYLNKKFSTFFAHPSLILQKYFLTHFNLARHLMTSIIITAFFFLCQTNVLTSCLKNRSKTGLKEIAVVSMISNFSLSKGSSISFPSILSYLYLTSINKVGSRFYVRKNGEHFVEVCLLNLCANKTP